MLHVERGLRPIYGSTCDAGTGSKIGLHSKLRKARCGHAQNCSLTVACSHGLPADPRQVQNQQVAEDMLHMRRSHAPIRTDVLLVQLARRVRRVLLSTVKTMRTAVMGGDCAASLSSGV
jgi:hypothetical protein